MLLLFISTGLIDSDGTIKIGDFGNSCLVSAPEKTEGADS